MGADSSVVKIKLDAKLARLVTSGAKTRTMRQGARDYPTGPAVFDLIASGVATGESIPIEILAVFVKALCDISDEDARFEGYSKADDLRAALLEYYPTMAGSDPVTVVVFRPRLSLFRFRVKTRQSKHVTEFFVAAASESAAVERALATLDLEKAECVVLSSAEAMPDLPGLMHIATPWPDQFKSAPAKPTVIDRVVFGRADYYAAVHVLDLSPPDDE